MRAKSLVGAACCGLMITLGGCGGGNERLSAPDFEREASEICRRGNHAVVRIDIPPITASCVSSSIPRAVQPECVETPFWATVVRSR